MPNLSPAEVAALKNETRLVVPSAADKVAAAKGIPAGVDVLAAPRQRATGTSASLAEPYLAPSYQVHASDQYPSQATFHGVDSWRLTNGTLLFNNDYVAYGYSYFVQQPDGNLVLYDGNNIARWDMSTWGWPNAFSRMIGGQLITYSSSGTVLAYTTPSGNSTWNLHIQEDGNVVIYAPVWVAKWASNTSH